MTTNTLTQESTTLKQFLTELDNHDWYYCYSDDNSVYKKGSENYQRLQTISKQSDEHSKLLSDYIAYIGDSYIGKDTQKPTVTEPKTAPAFNLSNLTKLVSDGQIFSVSFIKRTTGELRNMTCRIGVKKHLRGGAKAYNATAKGLLTVFDLKSKGYRSIPIEGIKKLSISGQTFNFKGA